VDMLTLKILRTALDVTSVSQQKRFPVIYVSTRLIFHLILKLFSC
jgi:hypothetical protein